MSEWKTPAEWAAEKLHGVPETRRALQLIAKRDGWQSMGPDKARPHKGRGGGWEYHITCLPEEAQSDFRARGAGHVLKRVALWLWS